MLKASLNIEVFDDQEDLYDALLAALTALGVTLNAENPSAYVEVLDDTGRMPL